MKSLHSKAVWVFFLRQWLAVAFGLALSSSVLISMMPIIDGGQKIDLSNMFMWWAILFFPAVLLAFAWSVLEAKSYKYELRDDAFRKEYGVIAKKFTSIPYDRIQNVDLYRGIVDQMFGLTQLQIQTAGSSISGLAEGNLPGLTLDEAEQLRDKLIQLAKGGRQKSI